MIRFACPSCKKVLKAREELAGAKVACARCGQHLLIPKQVRTPTVIGEHLPAQPTTPAQGDAPGESHWNVEPPPIRNPVAAAESNDSSVFTSLEDPGPSQKKTPGPDHEPTTPKIEHPAGKYCYACGRSNHFCAEICPACGVRQTPGHYAPQVFAGEPHRGIYILVAGIASLCLAPAVPLGPIAWSWANTDLRKMDAGLMDPEGRGMTQAGKVCGMISSFFFSTIIVLMTIYFGSCCVFNGLLLTGGVWSNKAMDNMMKGAPPPTRNP